MEKRILNIMDEEDNALFLRINTNLSNSQIIDACHNYDVDESLLDSLYDYETILTMYAKDKNFFIEFLPINQITNISI